VKICTDDKDYVKWIIKLFLKRTDFECLIENGYTTQIPEYHIKTYFNELKENEGYESHFMLYKKTEELL
jgi:tRNA G46 methylase TrmB